MMKYYTYACYASDNTVFSASYFVTPEEAVKDAHLNLFECAYVTSVFPLTGNAVVSVYKVETKHTTMLPAPEDAIEKGAFVTQCFVAGFSQFN